MKRARGFRAERELVRKLWKYGFAVIRGPASGSGARKIFYPDVVAIYRREVLVFEVKSRKKLETIYLDPIKVEKLREFAERAGGKAFIAVKISELRSWKIVPLERVSIDNGRCKLHKDVIDDSEDLDAFVRKLIVKSLDSFAKQS